MTDESKSLLGGVEYDPTTDDYYTNYATDDAPASTVVPEAVAEITGRPVEELRPLHQVLDPDALDGLLDSARGGAAGDVEVSFTYADFGVTASSSGVVVLERVEREERADRDASVE